MDQQHNHPDEAISLPRAVRESQGLITYMQLWRLIKQGGVVSSQPGGKGKHYRIRRSELERLIAPTAPPPEKK